MLSCWTQDWNCYFFYIWYYKSFLLFSFNKWLDWEEVLSCEINRIFTLYIFLSLVKVNFPFNGTLCVFAGIRSLISLVKRKGWVWRTWEVLAWSQVNHRWRMRKLSPWTWYADRTHTLVTNHGKYLAKHLEKFHIWILLKAYKQYV